MKSDSPTRKNQWRLRLEKFFEWVLVTWDSLASLVPLRYLQLSIILLITLMFVFGYFESLESHVPFIKATHGIVKGSAIVLLGLLAFFHRRLPPARWQKMTFHVLLLVAVYFLSATQSLSLESSLLNLWYPLIAVVMVYALSRVRLTKKHLYFYIFLSVAMIFVTFAFSFFSLIFRYSVENLYYFLFLEHRANFLLEEIRQYGKYVSLGPYIMLIPIGVVFLVEKNKSWARRILSFAMLLVAILMAVISNNRIDVLVIVIQAFIFLWILPKKTIVLALVPIILVASFGLSVAKLYYGFNLEERILRPRVEGDIETVSMRFLYWETALENFRRFPILGTGPNTYNDVSDFVLRRYYDRGAREYSVRYDYGIGVHNIFIERLADTGLLGFMAFVWMLWYFLRQDGLRFLQLRKFPGDQKIYVLFALASWTWILYGITDNGYGAQGFVTFFFLRGLINHLSTDTL